MYSPFIIKSIVLEPLFFCVCAWWTDSMKKNFKLKDSMLDRCLLVLDTHANQNTVISVACAVVLLLASHTVSCSRLRWGLNEKNKGFSWLKWEFRRKRYETTKPTQHILLYRGGGGEIIAIIKMKGTIIRYSPFYHKTCISSPFRFAVIYVILLRLIYEVIYVYNIYNIQKQ